MGTPQRPVASGQWLVARCFMITPQTCLANQMWSFTGTCSFGPHCSKHFPLDAGFLLCLAATQGCLNFSQRQIFIHQSVQCSTGQAWEGEGETSVPFSQRGYVLFFSPSLYTVTWLSGTILDVIWACCVCFSPKRIRAQTWDVLSKRGRPDIFACSFNSSWKVYS